MSRPQTADGIAAWGVFECLTGQVRVTVTAAIRADGAVKILRMVHGLDYSAALALAEKTGAESLLFFELLPEIENIMVRGMNAANE